MQAKRKREERGFASLSNSLKVPDEPLLRSPKERGVGLNRIFDTLFPFGLAAIFPGKVNDFTPLDHPDRRAGLKADLQRSACCPA
jgi:hypothetical protein